MSTTWEDICSTVKGFTKTVNQKAEELTEQAAVRLKCSAKKAELEEQYTALGKLTYEQTNAVSPSEKSEEIAQCIVRITELLDEIETLQATIENN